MIELFLPVITGLSLGYALGAWRHDHKTEAVLALVISLMAAMALVFNAPAWGLFGMSAVLTGVGVYKTWRDRAWLPLYLVSFIVALLSLLVALDWLPKT